VSNARGNAAIALQRIVAGAQLQPSARAELAEEAVDAITDHVLATLDALAKGRADYAPPAPKPDDASRAELVREALELVVYWRGRTMVEEDLAVISFIERAVLAYADPERKR
jgi:hypothetical protein